MNKKGFTLVELMAVLVILSMLILIVAPLVFKTINNSKEKLLIQNGKFYIKNVGLAIKELELDGILVEDGTYQIMSDGNICLSDLEDNVCPSDKILKIKSEGDKPIEGSVTLASSEVVNYRLKYSSGLALVDGEIKSSEEDEKNKICKLIEGPANEIGSKYQCKVKEGLPSPYEEGYYFYVLSHEDDGTANLIMERNICDDGTVATDSKSCITIWDVGKEEFVPGEEIGNGEMVVDKGPTFAMDYLNRATNDWSNVSNLNIIYNEEGENFTNFNITGKARLPKYSEVYGENKCSTDYGSCPLWLVNFLNKSGHVTGEFVQNVSGVYGYYTLSSVLKNEYLVWGVSCGGALNKGWVNYGESGVRPVINLPLDKLN